MCFETTCNEMTNDPRTTCTAAFWVPDLQQTPISGFASEGMFSLKRRWWPPVFFTYLTSLTHHFSMVNFSEKNFHTNVLKLTLVSRQPIFLASFMCSFYIYDRILSSPHHQASSFWSYVSITKRTQTCHKRSCTLYPYRRVFKLKKSTRRKVQSGRSFMLSW